jgi:hypothetical protein
LNWHRDNDPLPGKLGGLDRERGGDAPTPTFENPE